MIGFKPKKIGTVTEDGETGMDYYEIPAEVLNIGLEEIGFWEKSPAVQNAADKYALENWPVVRCYCAGDCCGHRFSGMPGKVIGWVGNQFFIVAQRWGINI